MHHHRIDRRLLQKNDVAREPFRGVLRPHGVAAIFDDDGFLVILLHMRQRFRQDAGLIERADMGRVVHGGLFVKNSARVLSDWRSLRKGAPPIPEPGWSEAQPASVNPRWVSPDFREACHRARIRATRWLHPGYGSSQLRRGQAAATRSKSQLAINSVPPVGAAIGKRRWPAHCRNVRSPANNAAATTKPKAAAIPILP